MHRSGQRGLIVGGWSGISPGALAAHLFCVREAPYDWLLPCAACVIHHGGTGTVAAALRAGVPSIVLPQISCQERFGYILLRENLATGIWDSDGLQPALLAAAIDQAIHNDRVRQHARAWQQVIAADPGVPAAVDWIEQHRARCADTW